MADFNPINTQEEFDRAISERIKRERETVSKQYTGQMTDLQTKVSELNGRLEEANKKLTGFDDLKARADKVSELEAKIKGYESDSVKTRIAREVGLPYELAARLSGEDEKAIREDAEALKKIFGSKPAPMFNPETGAGGEGKNAAWLSMSNQLKGD